MNDVIHAKNKQYRTAKVPRSKAGALVEAAFRSTRNRKYRLPYGQIVGKIFEPGDRRRVQATLDQTDQLNRTADRFAKLHLRRVPHLAQFGDALAKSFLKHGFGLTHAKGIGNGANCGLFCKKFNADNLTWRKL
jgi:hypothetical protein